MSSDEEDYMSAIFIVEGKDADVRPGLIRNRQQQRSHELFKKKSETDALNKERFRPIKVVEAQNREEGLNSAIGADNKGFNLLQKMGYKPGTGIGKSGEGRIDPLPIQLKTDRKGLGRTAAIQELREAKRLIRSQRQESSDEVTPEQFRARLSKMSNLRLVEIDLCKSQKACYNLDSKEGYSTPAESWFWPESVVRRFDDNEDETSDLPTSSSHGKDGSPPQQSCSNKDNESCPDPDDDFEPSEKLEMLTKYLRTSYRYCIWCCLKYDDEKDMEKECPGPSRDDH